MDRIYVEPKNKNLILNFSLCLNYVKYDILA